MKEYIGIWNRTGATPSAIRVESLETFGLGGHQREDVATPYQENTYKHFAHASNLPASPDDVCFVAALKITSGKTK